MVACVVGRSCYTCIRNQRERYIIQQERYIMRATKLAGLTLALVLSACADPKLHEFQLLPRGGGLIGRAPAVKSEPAPRSAPVATAPVSEQGEKVYGADECAGPVVVGRCHGAILPKQGYHPTCYGTWLDGTCTGPMF
jgi:hypothetical protein